jgi:hypothetical protein
VEAPAAHLTHLLLLRLPVHPLHLHHLLLLLLQHLLLLLLLQVVVTQVEIYSKV